MANVFVSLMQRLDTTTSTGSATARGRFPLSFPRGPVAASQEGV